MTAPRQNDRLPAILVVEDETILRIHALDIVKEAGFVPIEAANADDAIEILEKRSDVALMITDVHMPGSMDGITLANAVQKRWPPVKVVVVSGHEAVDENDLPEGAKFFGKPFETAELISHLRRVLHG
jgi:DNA-binding NtrC family response regulator